MLISIIVVSSLSRPNIGHLCSYHIHPETHSFYSFSPFYCIRTPADITPTPHKHTHTHWTKSPEVEASTMSLSSIGLYVVTAHSVLLTCLLCSVILLTVHPVLPPVYCGPSVVPSPIVHPHIRPVSPHTSPKQTSCLGRSCPRGCKQVPRGPLGLSMCHMAARSSSLLP